MYSQDGYYELRGIFGEPLSIFSKCAPLSACKSCNRTCVEDSRTVCPTLVNDATLFICPQGICEPFCQPECECTERHCYQGEKCGKCARNVAFDASNLNKRVTFFRQDGFCERCPEVEGWYLVLLALLLVFFLYIVALFAQYFRGLGAPRIFFSYMAVTLVFAKFDVNWPPEVLAFFDWISQFYIDIDFFSPECSVDLTFFMSWMYTMLIPIVLGGVLLLLYLASSTGSANPFGTTAERIKLKDPDRQTAWFAFTSKNAPAWRFVQILRARNMHVIVHDKLEGKRWILKPSESVRFRGATKNMVQLQKMHSNSPPTDGKMP